MKVPMDCGGKIINITTTAMITDSEHKISIKGSHSVAEIKNIIVNTEAMTAVQASTTTSTLTVITTPAVIFSVIKTAILIGDNCLVHRSNGHHRKIHMSVKNHVDSEKLFSYPLK